MPTLCSSIRMRTTSLSRRACIRTAITACGMAGIAPAIRRPRSWVGTSWWRTGCGRGKRDAARSSRAAYRASLELQGRRAMGPLTGLQVLELGNMIAAPTAGCLFGDFGARVVKVEHPVLGDDLRRWPPAKDDVPLWWKVTNRNKDLITLDLSKPAGQELCRRIVSRFDVLIENFRPGTLERWGLGYDVLSAINPRLILVRISGYGQTGPYSKRPGYGTVAEAMSGVPSFTGAPDGPPTLSAVPLVDSLAGMFAVQAAMMAIYERDVARSGRGQVIDVSLFESMFRLLDSQVIGYDQLGLIKQRMGNRMAA